ncbi:MAG: AAA family ATPase [Lautropia sp.]
MNARSPRAANPRAASPRRRERAGAEDGAAPVQAVGGLPLAPLFEAQRDALAAVLARLDSIAHAVLLTGPPGVGKAAFASALVGALLCEADPEDAVERPQRLACGRCDDCRWLRDGSHPDLMSLNLPLDDKGKPKSEISIDQVRGIASFAAMGAYRSRRRAIVVDPAECLNQASSNALLKLLEEPGPGLQIVLVTHRPERLPATVRSRCRRIAVPHPGQAAALDWLMRGQGGSEPARAVDEAAARAALAFAGGAPLHARAFAEPAAMTACRSWVAAISQLPDTSIVVAAECLASADIALGQSLLQRWVVDLARVQVGAAPVWFPDAHARLRTLAARCVPMRLAQADAGLRRQAALTAHPLNARLFLEASCALYVDAFETETGTRR